MQPQHETTCAKHSTPCHQREPQPRSVPNEKGNEIFLLCLYTVHSVHYVYTVQRLCTVAFFGHATRRAVVHAHCWGVNSRSKTGWEYSQQYGFAGCFARLMRAWTCSLRFTFPFSRTVSLNQYDAWLAFATVCIKQKPLTKNACYSVAWLLFHTGA